MTQPFVPTSADHSPAVESFLSRAPALLIDGVWQAAQAGAIPVIDPATGSTIAHIAGADESDVDRAVTAARKAFDGTPVARPEWGGARAAAVETRRSAGRERR